MTESIILIICDEPMTSRVWGMLVTDLHCHPIMANTTQQAVNMIEDTPPDVVVIDVTARNVNGVQICQSMREMMAAPIIFLTPINNETHMLEAYQAGADECIIKPISPALFIAKIKVWLHRTWTVQVESLDKLLIGDFTLDPAKHQLFGKDGKKIRLSNLEFRVLYLLMDHPNQLFSSDEIIERVWGTYGQGNSALVKNVIYRLRKKLETNPTRAQYIRTETGGYTFRR
jgi:DNA-binding response OmpR family regulator